MRGWGRWCERRRVYDGAICSYPSERTGIYDGSSLRAFVARVSAPPGGVDGRDPDDLASIGRSHDPSNAPGDGPSALSDRQSIITQSIITQSIITRSIFTQSIVTRSAAITY